MKFKEKIEAIRLRKLGKSYSEIRRRLKVSKSSLSLWLRDVKLTPYQMKRLYVTLRRRNAYKGAKVQQRKRIERTKQIITEAKEEIGHLIKTHLFLSGLMLYWAEGDKSEERGEVKFSNSDEAMIQLMMRWFREICKVPEWKFKIVLYIHTLHCRKDVEKHWSKITNVPLCQFYKTQIKPTSLKHRRNQLYNGTCAVRICDKNLFRKIKGWRLGFLEKIGLKPADNNSVESP